MVMKGEEIRNEIKVNKNKEVGEGVSIRIEKIDEEGLLVG